jgi:hypothetical protein
LILESRLSSLSSAEWRAQAGTRRGGQALAQAMKGAIAVNTGEPKAPPAGDSTNQKSCPVCSASFGCMAAMQSCWCAELRLSSEALADLRSRFADCLCPRCLALAVAERGVRQDGAKNPTEKTAI